MRRQTCSRYVDGSLSAVCLRYFNVYGPLQRYDAYGNVIPIFTRQLLRGEALTVFGDGEQTRDFVHVADVAQANVRAAPARRVTGAFNIGSGLRVSINELVRMMARASVTSPLVRYGPARAGDVRDSMADITAARSALDFQPTVDLASGVTEYLTWARQSAP